MEVKFTQFLNKVVQNFTIGKQDVSMNSFSFIKQGLKNHKYHQVQN